MSKPTGPATVASTTTSDGGAGAESETPQRAHGARSAEMTRSEQPRRDWAGEYLERVS